jgi:hypothetical protein
VEVRGAPPLSTPQKVRNGGPKNITEVPRLGSITNGGAGSRRVVPVFPSLPSWKVSRRRFPLDCFPQVCTLLGKPGALQPPRGCCATCRWSRSSGSSPRGIPWPAGSPAAPRVVAPQYSRRDCKAVGMLGLFSKFHPNNGMITRQGWDEKTSSCCRDPQGANEPVRGAARGFGGAAPRRPIRALGTATARIRLFMPALG